MGALITINITMIFITMREIPLQMVQPYGAINILRKVIRDDFVQGLLDNGAVFAPMRWIPAH